MIPEGEYWGLWVSREPWSFINIGVHVDVAAPNAILYFLWWQILVGRYEAPVPQPHWRAVATIPKY